MAGSPEEGDGDRGARLCRALEILARWEQSGCAEAPEVLLAAHPELRDLLEPMVGHAATATRPNALADELRARLERFRTADVDERYEIAEEVGRGGMGTVYRVLDNVLRRDLALKRSTLDARATAAEDQSRALNRLLRFMEEAQITCQLDHPGVVPVHELGIDAEGRAYFTMRLVRGRELTDVIARAGRGEDGWSRTRVLQVLLKACEAMAYAHARGVIHRDLKPENIMVGQFGEVYVMDWGLAKVIDPAGTEGSPAGLGPRHAELRTGRREELERDADAPLATLDGTVLGTPAYMPPEQARGEIAALDKRSDVYAIGAILYHALTGCPPYVPPGSRPSSLAVWQWVLEGPPRPIHELSRDVPPELEAICGKAMAREPAERYADMGELGEDLRAFLEGRVVRAHRTGALIEARKWVVRNKGMASALAVAFVALTVGLVVSLRALGREREATAEALRSGTIARERLILAEASSLRERDPARMLLVLRELPAAPSIDVPIERIREWIGGVGFRRRLRLVGHTGAMRGVRWSPDGSRLLTASEDGTARIWRASDGALLAELGGHGAALSHADWSPDGARVATSSEDGLVRVWAAESGAPPLELEGHTQTVWRVVWSPDGARLASASKDGTARIWSWNGDSEPNVLRGHEGQVFDLQWSPDGTRIATASEDRSARVWDLASGTAPVVLAGSEQALWSVRWSPDGSWLAAASNDGTAYAWEPAAPKACVELSGHAGGVLALDWSPDGARLATASRDGGLRLFDVAQGASVGALDGHEAAVEAVAWNPAGDWLASASSDGTLRFWPAGRWDEAIVVRGLPAAPCMLEWSPDGTEIAVASFGSATAWVVTTSGAGEPLVLKGDTGRIEDAAWSPDGRHVATASSDGAARIWDVTDAGPPRVLRGHAGPVRCIAWSPDGARLATGSQDASARIWATVDGALIARLEGHRGPIRSLSWSPSGAQLLTGSADGSARAWEAGAWDGSRTVAEHEGEVLAACWSPDGSRVLTTSTDGTARIGSSPGARARVFDEVDFGFRFPAVWSPSGQRVLVAHLDRTARVWSAEDDGAPIEMPTGWWLRSGCWSPDGARVLVSHKRGLGIWSAVAGGEPLELRGHELGSVHATAWSPDGSRVASGGDDRTVRVWNATTGALESVLEGHEDFVALVSWSPDGEQLLSVSGDGTARIWSLAWAPLRARLWAQTADSLLARERELHLGERPDLGR